MQFETLAVAINAGVATVDINRPHKANAMTLQAWRDLGSAFRQLDELPEVRVVVLRGAGKRGDALRKDDPTAAGVHDAAFMQMANPAVLPMRDRAFDKPKH